MLNPAKLLDSKWTAVQPKNQEKHFLVTRVDSNRGGGITHCEVLAIHSNRLRVIDWRTLKDTSLWLPGWQ